MVNCYAHFYVSFSGKEPFMYSSAYVWAKVLGNMESRLTPAVISTWFDDAEILELTDTKLVLYSPSSFRKDIILRRCTDYIKDAMRDEFQMEVELEVIDDTEIDAYRENQKKPQFVEFNPQFTFDKFVVGSSNRFAHAAAIAVANAPAETYNPLFIYGPSGLGKTHLLYAIASEVHKKHPSYNIVYIKGDQFTNELIAAVQEGRNIEFRSKYRGADLFLVDDIQFIAGKDSTQEEFFHTFNTLYESHRQIVLTADRPPHEMLRLEDRLKTRFEWGLIADIQPPDYETSMAILNNFKEKESIQVDEEVLRFIATNIRSSVRELEGAFKKVQYFSTLSHQKITLELAENALKDMIKPDSAREITVEYIIDIVTDHFQLSSDAIVSKKRQKTIAYPRQICMYLCKELTDLSTTEIGEKIGGRDHSTVIHGCAKIEELINTDPTVKKMIDILIKKINP